MGAWGSGAFENDDALDWLADFISAPPRGLIASLRRQDQRSRITAALRCPELNSSLDMGVVENAVAASEAVAAACGRPSPEAPDDLRRWASTCTRSLDDLRAPARTLLARLRTADAFRDLWINPESYRNWQRTIDDLLVRLS